MSFGCSYSSLSGFAEVASAKAFEKISASVNLFAQRWPRAKARSKNPLGIRTSTFWNGCELLPVPRGGDLCEMRGDGGEPPDGTTVRDWASCRHDGVWRFT